MKDPSPRLLVCSRILAWLAFILSFQVTRSLNICFPFARKLSHDTHLLLLLLFTQELTTINQSLSNIQL